MKLAFFQRLSILAAILLFSASGPAVAAHYGLVEDGWEERIKTAIFKVADTDFEEGLSIVAEYIEAFPENPGGYFFYAAGVQEKIQKLNVPDEIGRFYEYAEKCEKLCERRLRKNPGDTAARFFLGGIHGYTGLLEAKRRRMVKAFLSGVESKKHLERVAAERPETPDTYFGLGMLYYFSSRKSEEGGRLLSWIIRKFITDGKNMKAEGVEMIKRSIIGGSLARDYALSSLMWIHLYEGQYEQAGQIARNMSRRFTRDTASRWVLGRVALEKRECAQARLWFEDILDIAARKGLPSSRYPDVTTAIDMADLCESMNSARWGEADRLIDSIRERLEGDPKIVIEYQDEKNLLKRWNSELERARRTVDLVLGG
ncbi:MAG: hypothetical protein ACNS63_08960 [Candidatus Nitrospinota bacterium M3_3B_026]